MSDERRERDIKWHDWLRWAIVVATIVSGAISIATGAWETCSTVLPNVGAEATAEVCGEPALTDVPVVAILVLLFLLLLPDLAEVTLPGGIGLKRKLQTQEERLDLQRERQELLEQRFAFITQSSADARAIGNVVDLGGLRDLVNDAVNTRVRLALLERTAALPELPPAKAPDTEDKTDDKPRAAIESAVDRQREIATEISKLSKVDRIELERTLIRLWRHLGSVVLLADAVRARNAGRQLSAEEQNRVGELTAEDAQRLIDWREAFDSAIQAVNAARRAVLAGDAVADEEIATAVALGREIEAAATDLGLLATIPEGNTDQREDSRTGLVT